MMIFQVILFYMVFARVLCEEKIGKRKIILHSIRSQIEETEDIETVTAKDDARRDLVSVLVKNVKKIFADESEGASTDLDDIEPGLKFRSTVKSINEDYISIRPTIKHDVTTFKNLTLPALSDKKCGDRKTNTALGENRGSHELLHLTKDLMYHESPCEKEDIVRFAAGGTSAANISKVYNEFGDTRRSCIFCDNVQVQDCYDPKNKLIPSTVCEREGDVCYSQHTPFGIIDRGCFNVNHNLTTFVCSCNLCNYISISEMPYIFPNKRDWVDNVVELSRTRHFRKSVFKDMTCLRCEVNVTTKRSDMLDSANCLEGNVGALPTQQCAEDEICGVKAVKSTGFVWRGCVKSPLYNYWWALCDTDLCNYDSLISIYDYL